MNKKFLRKCLITLGLFLFFTLLIPLSPYNVKTAQAGSISSTDKDKNDRYRLNLRSITLVKGKSFTLKVYNLSDNAKVNFKSDDSEIASVSDDGSITANQVGSTIITVTIKDGNDSTSLTCDITVGPPAFSVKITKSRIILGLDESDLLRVILKPSNTAEVARFSSYDPDIASISIGGRVTAKKLGLTYLFAEIDATNYDGSRKFAVCTVIITKTEDAPLLEDYFNNHPELDLITESDLTNALEEFFNGRSEEAKTPLVEALNKYLDKKFDLSALRAKMN
jgi:uncharacterized protein YjdB